MTTQMTITKKTYENDLSTKEIFVTYVLKNKLLWYIAIANVFVYLIRYGVLKWSPVYLSEVKHFQHQRYRMGLHNL